MAESRLQSFVRICPVFIRSFTVSQIQLGRGKRSSRKAKNQEADTDDLREEVDYEALEDFLNEHGARASDIRKASDDLLRRDFQREQAKLKQKIMAQKYFRKPQEVNLLTWEAKEQIRYLHQKYPEEWTPEALAESFPISVEGIRRILRSTYRPKTEEEIVTHNRRVRAHWQELKEFLSSGAGPSDLANFSHVLDTGKLPLMINAEGAAQLPAPVKSQSQNKQPEQNRRIGLFESIVAGKSEARTLKIEPGRRAAKLADGERKVRSEQKQNVKLLTDIASAGSRR